MLLHGSSHEAGKTPSLGPLRVQRPLPDPSQLWRRDRCHGPLGCICTPLLVQHPAVLPSLKSGAEILSKMRSRREDNTWSPHVCLRQP